MNADDNAFAKLDQEKIVSEVAEKASEQVLKKAQDDLINRIQGKKARYSWEERGDKAPKDYDELFNEVKKVSPSMTDEDLDRRVEEKLQAKEDAKLKIEEELREVKAKQIVEQRKQFDKEWYELVQEKKLPEPSKEIQDKINAGDKLTPDEIQADEGLQARMKLAKISQSTGKSPYKAFHQDYDKEPAGMKAPVLGGRPTAPGKNDSEELDYDRDVAANRKATFGF